jgi:hypothetical protein
VIVIWTKQSSTIWQQSQLLLSQHSGYDRLNWASIQNTFSTSDGSLARGGSNGRQNLDHPKVYVAWSKHANYHDRNTGFNDVLSQLTDNAFRSQDWWYFHPAGMHLSFQKRAEGVVLPQCCDVKGVMLTSQILGSYIRADGSTTIGQQLGSWSWGDASSNPLSVHQSLCSQ